MDRRSLLTSMFACSAGFIAASAVRGATDSFQLKYMLPSCMYGYAGIEEVLAEVPKTGAQAIDLWPMVHGNQREQVDAMGLEAFQTMLKQHGTSVGCLTNYRRGPFGLSEEFAIAKTLNCKLIVTEGRGPTGLHGAELKSAIQNFIEELKPHLALAEENGVDLAIENHGKNLIESPDAMKYLVELRPSENLKVAFAPYHLPQEPQLLADLIRSLGNSISVFYAWQHGKGCMEAMPKEDELLQLPGRGPLDFAPIVQALADIRYEGWTEIFMHPFPRGLPIVNSLAGVTGEIQQAKQYLDRLVGLNPS